MEWKTVEGFEDYMVNECGGVKSMKNGKELFLKKRITHDGYVWYNLCRKGKQFSKRAHRLVAEAFIPNPENKPTVNHIDGNKQNCNVENLEWATLEEQMQHAYSAGLKKPMRGTLQTRSKLTEEQVKEIRNTYKAHDKVFGMRPLARKYGVSESVIFKAMKGTCYSNV